MLEALVLTLLKTVVATCVKLYITTMAESGKIQFDKELGYKVPSWYMNAGSGGSTFYAYGTSTVGDEFESLEDAQQQAIVEMATLIRRCNREAVTKHVRYDTSSVKQRALVDLFLKAEGLEEFIRTKAVTDRKEFVKVKNPQPDIRAFARLALEAKVYVEWQEKALHDLKIKVTQQKSEDLLDELDKEVQNSEQPAAGQGGDTPPATPPAEVNSDDGSGTTDEEQPPKPAPKAKPAVKKPEPVAKQAEPVAKQDEPAPKIEATEPVEPAQPAEAVSAPAEAVSSPDESALEEMNAQPQPKAKVTKGTDGFVDLDKELDEESGKAATK
jgi:hypothetical protein